MIDSVCGSLHYVGNYDNSVFYNYGDIVLLEDGRLAICTAVGDFTYLGCCTDLMKAPDPVKPHITQCRNCGAPTDRDGYCYYCGTYN